MNGQYEPATNSERASDRIEQELRRMIVSLELAPGAEVSEPFLIERLRCGRTPLREALQRLAQDHLVVSVPRRGISIAELSIAEFREVEEVRLYVEGLSARLAAERITDEVLAKIEAIIEKAEVASDAGDFMAVSEYDFEFHHLIALATGNRYLADAIAKWSRLGRRFGYLAWKHEGSARESLHEHRLVLAALRQHDPADAQSEMREHSARARDRMREALI
jgi:DNA-binding GntR family transcriptional regulator